MPIFSLWHRRQHAALYMGDPGWRSRQSIWNDAAGNRSTMVLEITGPWAWMLCLRTNLRGHWARFHKLYIHSLSTPGAKLSLFSLYGQRFPRYGLIFQNCYIWVWNLAIDQSSTYMYSFSTPGVVKEVIFTLVMQQFLRYRPIFRSTMSRFRDIPHFRFSHWLLHVC